MGKKCLFNDKLCFNTNSDLERYRIESIFDKEPETIAWIESWKNQKGTFYDIGSNIGIYSLYTAYIAPEMQVYSFEAVSNNFIALRQNLTINDFQNIFPFNIALSSKNSLSELFLSDLSIGNSGAQLDEPVNEKKEYFKPISIEKVLSFSIDQLISDFKFPVPNYVKLDVDGHESNILMGMESTIKNVQLKSILVEFNNSDEFELWINKFSDYGLELNRSFDKVINHSSIRRTLKGSPARNYIFSRN
jgi:FkbM family methyltransferase